MPNLPLPLPLIILGCIVMACVLGMRIGYAIAKKSNTHEQLQQNILAEEYDTLYQDMVHAEFLLKQIYQAVLQHDSNAICDFVEAYQKWDGIEGEAEE